MEEDEIRFKNILISLDNNMPIVTDECFNYGISGGCDEYCPVFKRKQCEFQEELEEKWKKIYIL